MYSLKDNGDSIAREFAGLVEAAKPKPVVKTASDMDMAREEYVEKDEYSDKELDSALKDMILDDEPEEDYASDLIDDDIMEMDSYADGEISAKAKYIIAGLNKISSSLRAKGEPFASDVVLATVNGIRSDMRKEVVKSKRAIAELTKIAKDLRSSGDKFAADMVLTTIKKIS